MGDGLYLDLYIMFGGGALFTVVTDIPIKQGTFHQKLVSGKKTGQWKKLATLYYEI